MLCNKEWLLKYGNPIIRYKTQTELLKVDDVDSLSVYKKELLQIPQVQKRLTFLKSLDFSRIHGSNVSHLENVLPMLNDFGVDYNDIEFKESVDYTHIIDSMAKYNYGEKLIAYPFLIQSGFNIEGIFEFILDRINTVYEFTRLMDYDIYDSIDKYKSVPKNFRDRPIIKPELVNDGVYRYPVIYDIVAFAVIYNQVNNQIQEKINNIISYVISPEYDRVVFGYGIIPLSGKRYYSMGWDCKKPFNNGYPNLHRLLLYSRFPAVVKSEWFNNTIDYLKQYKTTQGTYIFPAEYLIEKDCNWVLGSHMSLGENRRVKKYIEIESTFYMLKLLETV